MGRFHFTSGTLYTVLSWHQENERAQLCEWQTGDFFAMPRDLSDAKAVITLHDDNFALSDKVAIDQEIDGLLDAAVEFDDRAGAKFENVLEQHLAASKVQGHAEFDIEKKIEIAIAGRVGWLDGWAGLQIRLRSRRRTSFGLRCGGLGCGLSRGLR